MWAARPSVAQTLAARASAARPWVARPWVGPTWAIVVAGYLLGVAVGDRYEPRRELLTFASFRPGAPPTLIVPLTSWELAWDGRVPPATAPWGETQTPVSEPLWRGGRPVLYKPFSTPTGSSERFVAWQIARAAAAVYGAPLDPEELRSRYLTTDGGGQVALSTPSLSLARDHPALRPVERGPLMPVVMLLVGVPWALLLALALRLYRPGVTARARLAGLVAIPAGIMAVHIVGVALAMSHVLDYDGLSATVVILTRRLGAALSGGAWGLWVVALAVLAMIWWWVAGQFARIEFAPAPRRQREAAELAAIRSHPAVQALLDAFPQAKIADVRRTAAGASDGVAGDANDESQAI